MEFFARVLGGTALIICSISLFRVPPPNWHEDASLPEHLFRSVHRWSTFQRILRRLNNGLLLLTGGGIVATAFVTHGREWMLLWTAILLLLLICILFAMIDALTTLAGYRRALPEAARRSFGKDVEPSSPRS